MTVCKLFIISGHVQGVWYRGSTQEKAHSLGISGYAKNLPDGRVEVLACGTADKLNELETWLWQGPAHARVEVVENHETEQHELCDFKTI